MSDPNTEVVVQIDSHNLDKECIALPSDYLKFAHKAADAKRDVAEAEAYLSVIQANLAKEIRANPQDYGIDKLTEAGVVAATITCGPYKKAQAAVMQARHSSELATAVVWALEHKKRSLTLLVELHGMSYFSSPKVSAAGREAVEQMTQRKVRRRGEED